MKPRAITVKRAADMRYVGQEHPVTVDLPLQVFAKQDRAAIKRHFDDMHLQRYGTCAPAGAGGNRQPAHDRDRRDAQAAARENRARVRRRRRARPSPASARPISASALSRRRPMRARALLAGNKIAGPALIEEHASTTVLMPGDRLVVDAYGNLVISVGGR